jgi:hypothetical protein
MLAPRFRLSDSQLSDLATVCGIGSMRLDRVSKKVAGARTTIRQTKIEEVIRSELDPELAGALSRLVFGIAGTFRRTQSNPADFLYRLDASLPKEGKWVSVLTGWADCRPALQRLLETESVFLAAKAIDISYDFERVYVAGRLLTSVRPVFDEDRENIKGSTIVQTLRLEFIAPNGEQSSISVALDADDIRRLEEECRYALIKAEKAKAKIEQDCDIEAIVPGEEFQ